jgi:hypothetical protein
MKSPNYQLSEGKRLILGILLSPQDSLILPEAILLPYSQKKWRRKGNTETMKSQRKRS